MPIYRVPILLFQDAEGFWTAHPMEPDTALVGTGTTAADALAQIKAYLDWSGDQRG